MKIISDALRRVSSSIRVSERDHWSKKLKDKFGIDSMMPEDLREGFYILRQTFMALNKMPVSVVKACGVTKLIIRTDMGPSKPMYPNHGYFYCVDNSVTLNAEIFIHPDDSVDFVSDRGYVTNREDQTIIHEWGHALDDALDDLSKKTSWTSLSGWCPEHKPGLDQLIIDEPGAPKVVGEWFYDPSAGFTRFYAKRNPWDDWADSFCFYLVGLKDKLPANKIEYFSRLLAPYYDKSSQ